MKKIVLGLSCMLFTVGMFANNRIEKEKEKNSEGEAYGCTTTIWYKAYGASKVVSFYHDDCSSQSCCNDYLRRDIDILKLHYAMENTNPGEEITYLPSLEQYNDEEITRVIVPEEQP